MICCFFSSFKTFAILREATDPPAAVNVLDVSSESMAAFQVFLYGRFWVITEVIWLWQKTICLSNQIDVSFSLVPNCGPLLQLLRAARRTQGQQAQDRCG